MKSHFLSLSAIITSLCGKVVIIVAFTLDHRNTNQPIHYSARKMKPRGKRNNLRYNFFLVKKPLLVCLISSSSEKGNIYQCPTPSIIAGTYIKPSEIPTHHVEEALVLWTALNGDQVPPVPHIQRNWDIIDIERIFLELNPSNLSDQARLLALREQESGAWLQVIPSDNIGTFMDNITFRTCVALRLGCNIYKQHICHCNAVVEENGIHGLSCTQSKGRIPRHNELNLIIHRALTSVNIASSLEPLGLSRDDGKRPDGITLVPWCKGRKLVWDATCVDNLAMTYLPKTSEKPGSAAEVACKRKHEKYTKIESSHYIFKALAFETLGPWAEETKSFIDGLGSLLIKESGDLRAKHYLYQRISLAIQRGNAASILGTLPLSIPMDEIFIL